MTALLMPGSRIVIEIDIGLLVIAAVTAGIILTAMSTLLALAMLRLGEKSAPAEAAHENAKLQGENKALLETADKQRKLLMRQAEIIGSGRVARKIMQQSGM